MEKFSYLLHREGCTLYFAVLEQPEEWRGGVEHRGALSWEGFEGTVSSVMRPEIGEEKVYLRGYDQDMDMMISRADFYIEQDAIEKEAWVHRLLAEFVKAGGFSGKRNTPEASGTVTTYTINYAARGLPALAGSGIAASTLVG